MENLKIKNKGTLVLFLLSLLICNNSEAQNALTLFNPYGPSSLYQSTTGTTSLGFGFLTPVPSAFGGLFHIKVNFSSTMLLPGLKIDAYHPALGYLGSVENCKYISPKFYGIYQTGNPIYPSLNHFDNKIEIGGSNPDPGGKELLYVSGGSILDGATIIGDPTSLGTDILSVFGNANINGSATIEKNMFLVHRGQNGMPFNRIQSDDRLDFYNFYHDPVLETLGYSLILSLEASPAGNGGLAHVYGALQTDHFIMPTHAGDKYVLASNSAGSGSWQQADGLITKYWHYKDDHTLYTDNTDPLDPTFKPVGFVGVNTQDTHGYDFNVNGRTFIGNWEDGMADPRDFKLVVNGRILCEELKVKKSENWPDYVLKDGYKLMPIKELEVFINKNSHLPDVPSAEEINENGQNLSEINCVLVKKIEELTKYLIDQQKQIDELRSKIERK